MSEPPCEPSPTVTHAPSVSVTVIRHGDHASAEAGPETPRTWSRAPWARIGGVLALLALVMLVAKLTGLTDRFEPENIQALMASAGVFGFVVFLLIFALGELVHVPGLVFVGVASLAYGQLLGIAAAYGGALTSLVVSFAIVRGLGGTPLAGIRNRTLRRVLDRLDTQPIMTVALLRLVLWMAPALNYALALSNIRFRDYVLGSALGLLAPIVGVVIFFDWVASVLG